MPGLGTGPPVSEEMGRRENEKVEREGAESDRGEKVGKRSKYTFRIS